jgi:hypothetical protein
MGPKALLPLRRKCVLGIFITRKNPPPSVVFEPATEYPVGPVASTVTTRPPRSRGSRSLWLVTTVSEEGVLWCEMCTQLSTVDICPTAVGTETGKNSRQAPIAGMWKFVRDNCTRHCIVPARSFGIYITRKKQAKLLNRHASKWPGFSCMETDQYEAQNYNSTSYSTPDQNRAGSVALKEARRLKVKWSRYTL